MILGDFGFELFRLVRLHALHLASFSIKQAMLYRELLCLQRIVVYLRLDMKNGFIVRLLQVSPDKSSEGSHAHGCRFQQPCIAVDACPFVEPALLERSISAHADQVVAAVVHIFRHVVHLRGVTAGLRAHVETVEPHAGIAEYTVELQGDMLAKVALWDMDCFPIPAHARLRILVAYGLVAVRVAGFAGVGQGGHIVMRHADLLPSRIVEFRAVGSFVVNGVGFRQVVEILCATAEIFLWIGCVSESKLPPFIQADLLSHALSHSRQ